MHARAHTLGLVAFTFASWAGPNARAEVEPGLGASALPALHRLELPLPTGVPVTAAGSAGYGYTESVAGENGGHHRASGTLAGSYAPATWLALAARLDGRYDRHPNDADGSDGSYTGSPRLAVRAVNAREALHFGVELGAWFPGEEAPSLPLQAATFDALALLALKPSHSALTFGFNLGYRLDRSANSVETPEQLRPGDRLALGLSDFDSLRVAGGASYALSSTELLAELLATRCWGNGAPPFSRSPLHAAVGVRRHVTSQLQAGVVADASLLKRPTHAGDARALTPIDPRFSLTATLAYRFGGPSQATTPRPIPKPAAPVPAPAAVEPETAELRVALALDSASLDTARVTLRTSDGEDLALERGEGGAFSTLQAPQGTATLTVEADGYQRLERAVELRGDRPLQLEIELEPLPPAGQLRGLVRSFRGRGLPARIVVLPSGAETRTDEEGYFTLDVPPGSYEVHVSAEGYREQVRTVTVERDGVTVLNADLYQAK